MEESIKFKQPVADHGEVLTGKREGITEEANNEKTKAGSAAATEARC
jgi:hypothetical protein